MQIEYDVGPILRKLKGNGLRLFRTYIHIGFGDFLTDVKYNAAAELLPGPKVGKGGVSRREAYRQVPSTPGRLTNRTTRLSQMLRDGTPNTIRWKNLGSKNATTDPSSSKSFHGRITHNEVEFIGTWTPYVRDGSRALFGSASERMAELKKSLVMRAMWERGLKGNPPRLFLSRAYGKLRNRYSDYAEGYLKKWWSL